MDVQYWRWQIGGWGMVLAGGCFAIAVYVLWGDDALLLSVLFGVLALAGGLLLTGRWKSYAVTLSLVGILALLIGLTLYPRRGLDRLTLVFILLAVIGITKGIQTYRTAE